MSIGIRNLEWIVGENIIITTIGSTLCDFSFRVVVESIVTYRSNIKFLTIAASYLTCSITSSSRRGKAIVITAA